MTFDAAIWASSTALATKVALATWTAAWMLICFDQRRIAVRWQLVLQLIALLAAISASWNATQADLQWLWRSSCLVAIVCVAVNLSRWVRTKPTEVYEEFAAVDPPLKKKRKAAIVAAEKQASGVLPMTPYKALNLIGVLLVAVALGIAVYRAAPGSATVHWLNVMHCLASSVLLAVAISCAVELTFGAAPRALTQVNWIGFERVALVCCVVELLIGAVILTSSVTETDDMSLLIVSRLFALSFLLIDFIAWIIPHRVATFKRTGKSNAWVSLTLTAWLSVLTLLVLLALPSDWPWDALAVK